MKNVLNKVMLVVVGMVMPLAASAVDDFGGYNKSECVRYRNAHMKEVKCLMLKVLKHVRAEQIRARVLGEEIDGDMFNMAKQVMQGYLSFMKIGDYPAVDGNEVSAAPCFSEQDIMELLSGKHTQRYVLSDSTYIVTTDYVSFIEAAEDFNSMDCVPVMSVDLFSAMNRLLEIFQDAEMYCAADRLPHIYEVK